MGIACGIVGLPNVGKSTLFNALTSNEADAANYPFCTIDPNIGIVEVPDPRLRVLSDKFLTKKEIPATVEFVDIAGLVKGASKGEGLGNQFLGNIRQCNAVAHVVRCFEDENVVHVHGKVDPLHDIEIIETELLIKDLETVDKRMEVLGKKIRANDKEAKDEVEILMSLKSHLDSGKPARLFPRNDLSVKAINDCFLLTDKPIMYIANTDENGFKSGNEYIDRVKAFSKSRQSECVVICAKIEAEIALLDREDRDVFLADLGMSEPSLDGVIRGAYKLLGLCTYFTAGEKECRAWTVNEGSTAPQAAGVIHSDFERGFIRAEVMKYDEFVKAGSEAALKDIGQYRVEGKEYIVRDGDIIFFRFNV